ncbi:MAG: extracellular solute-binding protein [Planctomycetota bacterium]
MAERTPMQTLGRGTRALLALAAALLVVWSIVHVSAREVRGWLADREVEVTLRILHWGDNAEIEIVQTLVDAFEAEHPNIRVERLHANDYDTKLKTMLAAGSPPDLFYLRYEDVRDFADHPATAEQGLVMNLDRFVAAKREAGTAEWIDDYYPVMLDAFRWNANEKRQGDGPLYGLAKDFTTLGMYVNTDLFAQAGVDVPYGGWTWVEFREAMRKIAALSPDGAGPGDRVYGGVLKTWPFVLRQSVWSHGGSFFGGPGQDDFQDVTLDEPEALRAVRMIRDLRMEDRSVYHATGIALDEDNLFLSGRVGAIGPLGRWMTPRYRKIDDFEWDFVPYPTAEGVEPVSNIATVAWAMSSESRHPEAAWQLLEFLCGRQGQEMVADLGLAIPTMRSVAESDAFLAPGQAPSNGRLFLDLIERAKLGQSPPLKQFDRMLSTAMNEALVLGNLKPEEAAAQVEAQWLAETASPLQQREYGTMPWGVIGGVTAGVLLLGLGVTVFFARRQELGPIARAEERVGWMFISPWVVGFIFFVIGPLIVALLLATTQWSAMEPLSSARFVGLDNFIHMGKYDEDVAHSLWVTLYFVALFVPIVQGAALLVALLMNVEVRGIGWFRTAYFIPSVVTGVALALLWVGMFNNDSGLINLGLNAVLNPIGLEAPDWFGKDGPVFAVPGLVVMALWGVGGAMVIYLAGLKNIPPQLYEAATIDGAGPVRKFMAVTMPMLSPLIFFNLVMGIIGSFQFFTHAYVITGTTQGGENRSLLLYVLYLFNQAFEYHNMGYASAMATVLFAILVVLTLLVFRSSRGWVHYEGLKS